MESRSTEASPSRSWTPLPRPLSWMVQLWGVWFLFYFGGGLLAQANGDTGFFAATIDSVDALWIKLTVLNIPLQLTLILVSLVARPFGARAGQRVSTGAGTLATFLIAAHVVLSFALAFQDLAARSG